MTETPYISICIPTYDMGGDGAKYLAHSFDHLLTQSFKDFEVVVSDQSDTEGVAQVCTDYSGRLNIRRVDNRTGKRQGSANTNNAMRHARGRVLKILFQDDFLCREDALAQMAEAFEGGCDWLLAGSCVSRDGVTQERPMVPKYHPQIHFGWNTVSSPSVVALRAGLDLWYDENLIWLMDSDFVEQCHRKLGEACILPDTMVVNRLHEGQVTKTITRPLRRHELRYLARKFGLRNWRDLKSFLYQYFKALG